jgi:mannitol-1-/sugar-/sorbitol-6-phosphatase
MLLDLEGVLVDSRDSVAAHWAAWAERHQLAPERIRPLMHGRPSREVVAAVAPDLDAVAESAAIDRAQAADTTGVRPVPGAAAFLDALPAGRWAVVTSAPRVLATARLASHGLPLPSVMVCGEDVERGKPAPDGYLAAAEALGVGPERCLVVEDAPAGLEAAAAAGMSTLAVATTHEASELRPAEAVVPNLSAVSLGAVEGDLVVTLR